MWLFTEAHFPKNILQIILNAVHPVSERNYVSMCHFLRESIIHLRIEYPERLCKPQQEDPNSNSIRYLPAFAQFSHLTVENQLGKYDAGLLVFPMIDAYPKLVEFRYESNRPLPETDAKILLQSTTYTNKLLFLKSLKIELPLLTKSYIRYITTYIPATQLDTFKLVLPYDVEI